MNILQKSFDFILNYSVWVAVSVFCLTQITYINLEIPTNKNMLCFVGFSTVIGYNFIKHFEFRKSPLQLNLINFLNAVCLIGCFYHFFTLQSVTQVAIVIPFLITLFYTYPLGRKSIRNISGVKIYAIGFSWAFVTVALPIIEHHTSFYADFYLEFAQRFAFIIAITLPFEIRDLKEDSPKLHTIPQQQGLKRTKLFGLLLLMIFFFLEFFKDHITPKNITILPLIFLCSLLFLMFAKKTQAKYYANFFVEGIPVIWLLLLLLL